ncbi:MAG: ATPase, T2SS/T4P/T4SS family [Acidiferrobacteraceae bacterium]
MNFSTLWLYDDPADCRYRPRETTDQILLPPPREIWSELRDLYVSLSAGQDRERVRFHDCPCRVQRVKSVGDRVSYILRALQGRILPLADLGVPRAVILRLLNPNLTKLILIAGRQGSGKTTLGGSLVRERVARYGGSAYVIEDPPELDLDAVLQHGVIQQVDVRSAPSSVPLRERLGWLAEDALRCSTDLIFLGEVRRDSDAGAVATMANVGSLVVTTIHGSDVASAVERFTNLASSYFGSDAAPRVASSLAAVLHLSLNTVPVQGGEPIKRLMVRPVFIDESNDGLKAQIRDRRFTALKQEEQVQTAKLLENPDRERRSGNG